jgi:hypothetical protein
MHLVVSVGGLTSSFVGLQLLQHALRDDVREQMIIANQVHGTATGCSLTKPPSAPLLAEKERLNYSIPEGLLRTSWRCGVSTSLQSGASLAEQGAEDAHRLGLLEDPHNAGLVHLRGPLTATITSLSCTYMYVEYNLCRW